jgi:hypothetical protein
MPFSQAFLISSVLPLLLSHSWIKFVNTFSSDTFHLCLSLKEMFIKDPCIRIKNRMHLEKLNILSALTEHIFEEINVNVFVKLTTTYHKYK